jgi:hypothetical protein
MNIYSYEKVSMINKIISFYLSLYINRYLKNDHFPLGILEIAETVY